MRTFFKRVLSGSFFFLLFVYAAFVIKYPEKISVGIVQAINRCINVVIPSLFAFMVFSDMIIQSRGLFYLSKPFCIISKYIFNLPKDLFSVFLISNVAGFPVGAKLLSELLINGRIDKKDAQKMLCFCYCAGPAFFSSVIGLSIFGDVRTGMVIYLSCLISNSMLACIICRMYKISLKGKNDKIKLKNDLITQSIIKSGKAMISISLMIVFFSTLMTILKCIDFFDTIGMFIDEHNGSVILSSCFEITQITDYINDSYWSVPIISAICSFGGLCVLIQLRSLVSSSLSFLPFLITRPVCALFSFANSIWLRKIMLSNTIPAFSCNQRIFVKVNNLVPSVCLLLMIFILWSRKRVEISK